MSTTEQPQIIRLCRRQTVWQASDREGRVLAVINLTFMVINLALIMINAWLGHWWITPISLVFAVTSLWLASSAIKMGAIRGTKKWIQAEERRRDNWRWN